MKKRGAPILIHMKVASTIPNPNTNLRLVRNLARLCDTSTLIQGAIKEIIKEVVEKWPELFPPPQIEEQVEAMEGVEALEAVEAVEEGERVMRFLDLSCGSGEASVALEEAVVTPL